MPILNLTLANNRSQRNVNNVVLGTSSPRSVGKIVPQGERSRLPLVPWSEWFCVSNRDLSPVVTAVCGNSLRNRLVMI
ncbi:hypothetical protein [Bradyrhizobium sp. SRS-191]|uniref:hypothetical protein n=1 Tax=Bradyrhizobium sp. SRS-191 TaxID=2962606 RepID=UPI00211E8D84|nr:hypothetical protein [Bradyrhizobium sp. SRS-191]